MFDLIIKNITQRKLRAGLTVFGIAFGILAVIVMGGMSEHFNMTFDKSISLTADKIRVFPEIGFGGGDLNDSIGGGSVSDVATEYGRQHGITVIDGGCPLMFAPTADAGHRVMRAVFTATGKVPRKV